MLLQQQSANEIDDNTFETFEDVDKNKMIHEMIVEVLVKQKSNSSVELILINAINGTEIKAQFESKKHKVYIDGVDCSERYKPRIERKKY